MEQDVLGKKYFVCEGKSEHIGTIIIIVIITNSGDTFFLWLLLIHYSRLRKFDDPSMNRASILLFVIYHQFYSVSSFSKNLIHLKLTAVSFVFHPYANLLSKPCSHNLYS